MWPHLSLPTPTRPSSAAAASSLEAALHSGEAVPWHTDNKDDDGEANHACTGSEPPVPALELLDIHDHCVELEVVDVELEEVGDGRDKADLASARRAAEQVPELHVCSAPTGT